MTIGGRVLDRDGKPVAGATVAVVARARRQYRSDDRSADRIELLADGKTDAEGRFVVRAPRTSSARFWEVYAVARAKGYALAWARMGPDAARPEVVLRLPPEQAVRGRLVDLQGLPAAGVKVSVAWVGRERNGEFDGVSLADVPKRLGLWPEPVTTDDQGRFVLHGLNRDQGDISLRLRDDRFAAESLTVRPAGKPRPGATFYAFDAAGNFRQRTVGADEKGQPEEPAFTLAPAQVLEGRVVYEDTGRPAVGATVDGAPTDERGRFRLPVSAEGRFGVMATPPEGQPYLTVARSFEWPKGAVRHAVKINLPRGVLVRGKVTEAGSGKPASGAAVQFYPRRGADSKVPPGALSGWQVREVTGPDGRFRIAVTPGTCHLLVQGPTADFVHVEISSEMLNSGRPGGSRFYPDAAVKLANLSPEGEVKEVAITLGRGVTVRGRVLGPDGKPVARVILLHRLHVYHDLGWHSATEARDGWFEVAGLDPDKTYPVFFLDAEHQWGATVQLSGRQAGQEVTVLLAPCGKATARYVDGQAKPRANLAAAPDIVVTPGGWNLYGSGGKNELLADSGSLTNIDRHNYGGRVKTDAAGRITFPALIPGATYRVARWEKDEWRPFKEFTVESGKTLDLGDVIINEPK
jgi:protocatechuate 3,4-dioxygenase beta subunit